MQLRDQEKRGNLQGRLIGDELPVVADWVQGVGGWLFSVVGGFRANSTEDGLIMIIIS